MTNKTTPTEALESVVETGHHVLRCVESSGRVVDFGYVGGIWVRLYEDAEQAHPCDRSGVYQTAELCDPDIHVIDHHESLFTEVEE